MNNARVIDVLDEIENNSEFYFLFNQKLVDVERKVDVDAKELTIDLILTDMFAGTDVHHQVNDRLIVLTTEKNPVFDQANLAQQKRTVSGSVSDESGQPLPGVTVVVKGTTQGTVTNADGNYSLTNIPEDATLVFSFVGMLTQEIPVGNQTSINVTMVVDAIGIEEVVAIGYGTMKKSDLTGAVSSVSAEDVDNIPVQSIDMALRGKIAGVNIQKRSGAPDARTIIRIRGINSIQGGNDPLIIVDGFPMTEGLEAIDPNDIESVEVLKDASSTSIYGARATNGVIIVTTKSGKSGPMRIDIDSYYGLQSVAKLIDFADAKGFMEIANERAVNDGEDQLFFPNPSQVTANTNWQEEIFQTSPIQNYNLTFSGGNEKLRYSMSGNYFDQEGIIKGSDYNKITLRSNIDSEINKRIAITNSLLLTRFESNSSNPYGAIEDAFRAPPTLPAYDPDGNYQAIDIYPFSEVNQNPLAIIDGTSNQTLQTRLFNNFGATFSILNGLTFKSTLGVDYVTSLGNNYTKRFLIAGKPGGKASKSSWESYSLLNENIFNYDLTFGENQINAVAGYTAQTYKSANFSAGSGNFVSDDLLYNALGSGSDISIPSSGGSKWGISSWLGRINLNLKNKYLVTLSGRADGSSRFAKGNKWSFFPSGAFAWKLSEEEWFKSNQISSLKFRLSVGQTGNQAVSPYQTMVRMSDVQVAFGDALNIGYAPANIANKELSWETTTQYDAGLDFGFFKEKIRLSVDYYYKLTTDLLARVDLPPSAGFTSSTQNIGSMSNQGFEFQLDAVPVTGKFKWDLSANFYINRNKIVELAKGADLFAPGADLLGTMHILREGEPISMFYGYVWDRIDENGQNTYKDLNSDGKINNLDRTIIGNPHPKWNAGLNNTFSYNNWQLSIFLESTYGHDILNISSYDHIDSFYKGRNQLSKVVKDYWTPENPDAKYPKPSSSITQLPSDVYVEDGSYLKIRNINLSYSLPSNNLAWLRNLTIYVSGENLFTFTKYSWYDPEVSAYSSGDLRLGTEHHSYPQSRVYTIGLKLGF